MKLHNRQIRAKFWQDGDLQYDFSRDERFFYIGLWQIADDSGCLERNAKDIKVQLFPADIEVTPDGIDAWMDHFIAAEKLTPYTVAGKEYLFINSFHEHQTLERPVGPTRDSVPLPPWIVWFKGDSRRTSCYVVSSLDDQGPDSGRPQDGQWPTGGQPEDGQGPAVAPLEVESEPELEVQAGDESSTPDMPSGTSPDVLPDASPDTLPDTPPKTPRLTPVPAPPQTELFEHYVAGWQQRYATEDRPPGNKADFVQLTKLVKDYGLEKCKKLVDAYLKIDNDAFFEGHPLNKFYAAATVTKLLATVNGGGQNGANKRGSGSGAVKGGLGSSGRYSPPAPREAFGFTGEVKDWGRSAAMSGVPESSGGS